MAWEQVMYSLENSLVQIVNALPIAVMVLVIILIGYLVGWVAKKIVKTVFNRVVWRFLRKTIIGQKFEDAGIDLGSVLGGVLMAVIIALSILLAINSTGLSGPAVDFIVFFINLLIRILGGLVVLAIGIPLAMLAAEYIAKLIGLTLGEKNGGIPIIQTAVSILLFLFVLGLALGIMLGSTALLDNMMVALPATFTAAVIIIIGYIVADMVGGLVKSVVEKLSKPLESTDVGAALKNSGIEMPSLISGLLKATIIVISITIGIGMIDATGLAGEVLGAVTFYLPRILASIVILSLGLALILILSKYVGRLFRTVAKEKYSPIADLFEYIVSVGLVAVFITIALNLLGLGGDYVFSLIIGTVIIAIGVLIVDAVTKVLSETHSTFDKMIPLIGTVFVFIVVYVGLATIVSQINGSVEVMKIIAYGIAAALALLIIPVMFYLVKTALKEASSSK
ncbi:mechanosensitive ion channel family protein [Thermosphaera aggregans]|uniref:Uncharacterized protein n=1 Tax=Thermosphaera aggregans (strain DSM 11486 / M11TL) TaxID=633148 RepID=D5U2Q5_THEAM|nr:hypothetical protein [Thermosphaera aggregans]ADG91405.1 hypothetical protein Tagg_1136 [Thermosphaera aggregans DSM 11486]